jgi:hypothetical protein
VQSGKPRIVTISNFAHVAISISARPTLNDLTLCTDVITELEEIEAMLSPQFGGLFSMPLSNISKEDLGEMQVSYSPPRNIGIGIFSDSSCTFPISDERSMSTVAPADELNKEIDVLMSSFNDSVSFVSPSPVQPEGIYALGDALNSLSLRDQSFVSPYFANYATFPLHPSLEASDPLAAMSHTDFYTEKGWLDFLHAVSPPAEALPALMSPFPNMSQEPDSPKEMDVVQRSSAPSPEPMDTREDEPVPTRTRLSQKRHRRVLTDLSIPKTLFNQTRSALGLATTQSEESSSKSR